MPFKRSTTTYGQRRPGDEHPYDTPFSRASREWDQRLGSARVQARNWRLMAFGAMAGMLLLGVGLIVLSQQKQVETFLIEMDRAGLPGRITLAGESYTPDDATVGYFVAELVKLVRQRPLDPVVMRQSWTKAYHFLAGGAVASMNRYAASDPGTPGSFADGRATTSGGRLARTVEISSVVQQAERTWQVRWVEVTYANGVERRNEAFTGLFHVAVRPPTNEVETFRNPLGLYVTDFNWSREYTPAPGSPTPGSPAPGIPASNADMGSGG